MCKSKRALVVIPARGGSKRIPHKNIKPLNGKPLIEYTIDVARQIVDDENICVSTDSKEIARVVEGYGLKVPFIRPDYLATDAAGTYEVLLHALCFYEKMGRKYDNILLLQPTSPFRLASHVYEAFLRYSPDIDMVVSVKNVSSNPYYNCFEEDEAGFLHLSKEDGKYTCRQDIPQAWEYNGAIYIINAESLKLNPLSKFKKKVKYVMDDVHSIDIDTPFDWHMAEYVLDNHLIEL